jgi:hypothetical protein
MNQYVGVLKRAVEGEEQRVKIYVFSRMKL